MPPARFPTASLRTLFAALLLPMLVLSPVRAEIEADVGPAPADPTDRDAMPMDSIDDLPEVSSPMSRLRDAIAGMSIDYELDAYYSNISLFVPLTEAEIKDVGEVDELDLYRVLARESFSPRFFVVEFSVNPLPVLGTYLREQQTGIYDDAEIGADLNLIQALTEGFEEPYALSLFIGNVINFSSPQQETAASNKGYTGLLLSIGDQHIRNNQLIDDPWFEFEWKVKGDRRLAFRDLSWSFRIGGKWHDNPDISDVYYLAARRSHFDRHANGDSWFNNTGIEYRIGLDQDDGDVVHQQIFFDKKWPLTAMDGAFSLGVGLIQDRGKYRGALLDPERDQELRLMIRPGFDF